MIELVLKEKIKIAFKQMVAYVFDLFGGLFLARLISSPGVIIIAYHRIIDSDESAINPYISVDKAKLDEHIEFYKKYYSVVSLNEAINLIKNNKINRQYLVLTFDDGYKDNYSLGLNTFRENKIQPAIFVTTDCIDKQIMLWPDIVRNIIYKAVITNEVFLEEPDIVINNSLNSRICAFKAIIKYIKTLNLEERSTYINELENLLGKVPPDNGLMLNWDETRKLYENGVTIGSHTVSHPVLSTLSDETVAIELTDSKNIIEKELGAPVKFFAYPNGTINDFNDQIVQQVKNAGYEAAVTTIRGINKHNCDLFRLRRTGVYLTDSICVIKAKIAFESFFC